ncbi:hypothetical protein L4D20_12385 [Vibrio kyushuensis]|uniref:hypothetical protein n=1 Tax=Vibrio TaxID=662 RepID=UPI003D0B170C
MNRVKSELYLCAIATVLVLMNVIAHLLGAKMFVDLPLAEITVGLTPVVMMALGVVGFKVAGKEQGA